MNKLAFAWIKYSLIILLFLSGKQGLSQTYVRSMDIGYPIEVTIIIKESDTLNSPIVEIQFLDDFRFQAIEPKCEGDYKWCVYHEDLLIASMRFQFRDEGLIISTHYHKEIDKSSNPELVEEKLNKVFGHYTLLEY